MQLYQSTILSFNSPLRKTLPQGHHPRSDSEDKATPKSLDTKPDHLNPAPGRNNQDKPVPYFMAKLLADSEWGLPNLGV